MQKVVSWDETCWRNAKSKVFDGGKRKEMVRRNEEIKISPQKGNGGTTAGDGTSISHTEAGWLSLLTFF